MKTRTITPDQVLDQLRCEPTSLPDLAKALWVDEDTVKPIIADLLSKGRIQVGGKRVIRYKLVKAVKVTRERLNTSVAGVPAPPPMSGDLKGYAGEIRQRMELAMLGRGRS